MSEDTTIQTPGADGGVTEAEAPRRRFRVVCPEPPRPKKGEEPLPKYSGIHPTGLRFTEGVAETEEAIKAHACLELIPGCQVLDAATGKPAWPKDKPAAKK